MTHLTSKTESYYRIVVSVEDSFSTGSMELKYTSLVEAHEDLETLRKLCKEGCRISKCSAWRWAEENLESWSDKDSDEYVAEMKCQTQKYEKSLSQIEDRIGDVWVCSDSLQIEHVSINIQVEVVP